MVALILPLKPILSGNDYFRLRECVTVIYGEAMLRGACVHDTRSLWRLFRKIGRTRQPVRLLVMGGQMLTAESVEALNALLFAGKGLSYFPRMAPALTKYDVPQLFGEFMGLKWKPLRR